MPILAFAKHNIDEIVIDNVDDLCNYPNISDRARLHVRNGCIKNYVYDKDATVDNSPPTAIQQPNTTSGMWIPIGDQDIMNGVVTEMKDYGSGTYIADLSNNDIIWDLPHAVGCGTTRLFNIIGPNGGPATNKSPIGSIALETAVEGKMLVSQCNLVQSHTISVDGTIGKIVIKMEGRDDVGLTSRGVLSITINDNPNPSFETIVRPTIKGAYEYYIPYGLDVHADDVVHIKLCGEGNDKFYVYTGTNSFTEEVAPGEGGILAKLFYTVAPQPDVYSQGKILHANNEGIPFALNSNPSRQRIETFYDKSLTKIRFRVRNTGPRSSSNLLITINDDSGNELWNDTLYIYDRVDRIYEANLPVGTLDCTDGGVISLGFQLGDANSGIDLMLTDEDLWNGETLSGSGNKLLTQLYFEFTAVELITSVIHEYSFKVRPSVTGDLFADIDQIEVIGYPGYSIKVTDVAEGLYQATVVKPKSEDEDHIYVQDQQIVNDYILE